MQDKKKKARVKLDDLKKHAEQWGMDTSYRNTFLIGGKFNTDGWSGAVNSMKKKSSTISNYWQLSFSEIKHEKQIKQKGKSDPKFGNSQPYLFGKINNLYTLQLGFGKEKLLLPAVLSDNLSVSFRYNIGGSLAMLKPYYLKLLYTASGKSADSTYLEGHAYNKEDSATFLNATKIYGAANWELHLNEISFVPGCYLEAAITITRGKSIALVQKITLGINLSIYKDALPIMADQRSYSWTASLYAGLYIGKRLR
jgi:hypothetical protein